MDFSVQADHRVKLKESDKKDKNLDLATKLKKTVKHESDIDTNCNCCTYYSHQRNGKKTRGFGNKKTSEDNPHYSIAEIGQNTEKSPGDLWGLVVT